MLKVEQIGALHSDLRLGHRWLTQMGEAAHRCGVTIQYCMSQPRHLLTALLIPSVTQVACCLVLLLSSWVINCELALLSTWIHNCHCILLCYVAQNAQCITFGVVGCKKTYIESIWSCIVWKQLNLSLLPLPVLLPSVLWRCWLGSRKGIRPVKNWVVGCWCGYLSGARCRLAYVPLDATATHCLLLQ